MVATANRLIDPKVLSRTRDLRLIAKTVVEGFVAGLHRSPYHGFSVDFVEYREYSPGDDVRGVDWKVYGRSDRFYVKKFEGDTNTQLYFLLDTSQSMAFSSDGLSKIDYARYLVAALAYLAARQNDAGALLAFNSERTICVPPRTRHGHLMTILNHLENLTTRGNADISEAMERLASLIRKRSLVILVSDFYQETEKIVKGLRYLHHRGNDVIVFHVLDPMELDLSLDQISTLEDMENHDRLPYIPEVSRKAYLELLRRHIQSLRKECEDIYIDYQLLDTRQPLDRALHRYLSARSRRY